MTPWFLKIEGQDSENSSCFEDRFSLDVHRCFRDSKIFRSVQAAHLLGISKLGYEDSSEGEYWK